MSDDYYRHEDREREIQYITEKKRRFEKGLIDIFNLSPNDQNSYDKITAEMQKNGSLIDWVWFCSENLNLQSFPIQETTNKMVLHCFFKEAEEILSEVNQKTETTICKIMKLTATTFQEWQSLYFSKYKLQAMIHMIKTGDFKKWTHWYFNGSSYFSAGIFALYQMRRLANTKEEKAIVSNVIKRINKRLRQNGDIAHYRKYKKIKLFIMKFF